MYFLLFQIVSRHAFHSVIYPLLKITQNGQTYQLTCGNSHKFYSTSVSVLVTLIYLKHKRSSEQVIVDFHVSDQDAVLLTKSLMRGLQLMKKTNCSPFLKAPFHCQTVDRLLSDLNFKYRQTHQNSRTAYFHYSKREVFEYNQDYWPHYTATFIPPASRKFQNSHNGYEIKECYLNYMFNCNSVTLYLKSCNFLTLYQYIP